MSGASRSSPAQESGKKTRNLLGGIVAGAVGAAIVAGAFLAVIAIARSWLAEARVYGWSEEAATIVEARAWAPARAHGDPLLSVRFRYTYGGRTYESSRVDARSSARVPEAFQLAALWQAGSVWPCYVDPRDPEIAVLRRESLWWGFAVLLPLVVGGGLGGLLLYAAWASVRADDDRDRAAASSSLVASARQAVRRFSAILLVVVLVLVTYVMGVRPLLSFESAKHWREVPCTIVASRARAHGNGMRTGYSAEIAFQYSFDGRPRAASAYDLAQDLNRSYAGAAEIVMRYPAGSQAKCYVDPTDPDRAVLDRSLPRGTALGLLPLGFLAAVLWGFAGSGRRRSRRMARGSPS